MFVTCKRHHTWLLMALRQHPCHRLLPLLTPHAAFCRQDSDDEGKSGMVKASGNLFIAVVGAGVLGLPYGV
jgi:hypothetical protein